ncbi:MAG: BspA family leucine-rich repeat surface protein [Ruminococcus sp.]|uniref:BspA family leucine-rich repeat surface protein n=1 Tax=Ruminococcus sp. TaxID=41978 RepID=UPI0025F8A608|nr:BspA family leucine-rich repeat surface protein [Ruminococcus sp.]MBO4866468.1 BspA family leucine-rich repeat surface protein [Ruminococcus sp.]
MQMKKILAVVMSLCMTAGVVSYGAPVITQTITAQAEAAAEAECYSFDEETGVLTLKGNVDSDTLKEFRKNCKGIVKSVVAEKGTVFPADCSSMFSGFYNCTSFDLANADTSNVKTMKSMFSSCGRLTTLDLSGFDTSNVTDMNSMFMASSDLTFLDLTSFDTSNVKYMDGMFAGCSGLTTLDLSSFDTYNVTDMNSMFYACYSLTSLDLSSFYTRKVTNMDYMFSGCEGLTTLDISSFNTSNVTSMRNMFKDCTNLTTLDLRDFDTKNVRYLDSMFENCSSLISIDLSGFETSNTKYISQMFKGCSKLKTIDISSFDTSKVTNMGKLFDNCTELKTIYLGENFKNIKADAKLPNGEGWVNTNDPETVISGDEEYAVIENSGKNTYKSLPIEEETYPINIKVEYSEKYHQVRFKWNKVEGADRYGIAVYLAGKWKVQAQNITDTVYTSPKNLTTGMTYKVAIAARVNGKWDTANAIKNAVTCTIKKSYVKPDREFKYCPDLYVIADEITMYLGPDTSYGKVTTIPGKTYLQELGDMKNNNNWAFTEYRGQYGWVQVENEFGERQIEIRSQYVAKPVIYLYPEKETDVHVEVELTEADLSTTYPKYNNGWDVVAKPDGSLVNKADGTHHRYLFWDAVNCRTEFDLSKGFCVAGSDTENFLKEKLSYMGLTEDEMNEFIVYWLPKMEHNKYNLISFQSDKYTDSAKLNITPAPDSMLRVFMTYASLEEAVDIEPQELSTFERSGFTVVEWGGSEVK